MASWINNLGGGPIPAQDIEAIGLNFLAVNFDNKSGFGLQRFQGSPQSIRLGAFDIHFDEIWYEVLSGNLVNRYSSWPEESLLDCDRKSGGREEMPRHLDRRRV